MEYKLADLFDLQMGKTPSRNDIKCWDKGVYNWISIADLSNCGQYIHETKEKISDYAVKVSGIKVIPANTVIMSFKLSIGKVAITSRPIYSNEAIMAFINKGKIYINPEYLYYLLLHKNWEDGSNKAVMGKTLNKSNLSQVKIKIDSSKYQDEIVKKLNLVNQIITDRKKQLKSLDELVKSRFIEMFGNPITNEMGWEKVQLSACIESIDNGKSLVCDASARQGNWPAVLKLSAATYGFYRPEENKAMLDETQFAEDAAVRSGDLLFTRKNTPELVGMCAYVYDTPSRLMMPDLIFRLNTTNRCNKVFLWKLINHDLFRDCIKAIATGSAKSMSNISKERLLSLEIILPPAVLQEQFAAFVVQTDKSRLAIQKSLDETQLLFDSLMQKYFG